MLARKRMVNDRPRALAALERFVELTAADRRDRATAGLVRETAEVVGRGLEKQGRGFRRGLVGLKAKWRDEEARGTIWQGDWMPYFDEAVGATRGPIERGLYANMLEALVMGGGHLVDDVGVPLSVSWGLENPRAVEWATRQAAGQVTKVNLVTMRGISRVIVEAVRNGDSYTRTAERLAGLYEFSAGRAERIAVFEIGSAYEQGKAMMAREVERQGVRMERKAQSAGDGRVRPSHRDNQAVGWIGLDEVFPSGDEMLPSDPGCRCVILYRAAREAR